MFNEEDDLKEKDWNCSTYIFQLWEKDFIYEQE